MKGKTLKVILSEYQIRVMSIGNEKNKLGLNVYRFFRYYGKIVNM